MQCLYLGTYQTQIQDSASKEQEENEYKVDNYGCHYIQFFSLPQGLQKSVLHKGIQMSIQLTTQCLEEAAEAPEVQQGLSRITEAYCQIPNPPYPAFSPVAPVPKKKFRLNCWESYIRGGTTVCRSPDAFDSGEERQ